MRLDGEVYRLADGYVSVAVPDVPASRAAALLATRPRRLIAARRTAAWIWGARGSSPARGEYLVDLSARWQPAPSEGLDVIESVVHPGDVTSLAGSSVTTPLRTAVDLARFRSTFDEQDADAVRQLADIGDFGLTDAIESMERSRNLSGKLRATRRLAGCLVSPN